MVADVPAHDETLRDAMRLVVIASVLAGMTLIITVPFLIGVAAGATIVLLGGS